MGDGEEEKPDAVTIAEILAEGEEPAAADKERISLRFATRGNKCTAPISSQACVRSCAASVAADSKLGAKPLVRPQMAATRSPFACLSTGIWGMR